MVTYNSSFIPAAAWVGLGTEFRSEKIPRNRHSEFRGRANSEARNGTERNSAETAAKLLNKMICLYIKVVLSDTIFEIFGCRVLFWVGLSSTEWFGTTFREFVSIFCCTERNYELFFFPEGFGTDYERLLLFLFRGIIFFVGNSQPYAWGWQLLADKQPLHLPSQYGSCPPILPRAPLPSAKQGGRRRSGSIL
jgi:hypothetical protein